MEHQTKRGGLIATALFLAAALLLFGLWQSFSPGGSMGPKQITIEVIGQDGNAERFSTNTHESYLKQAAETVLTIEGEESPYGFVLYAVNGVSADFRAGTAYWAIYVNGEYGNYSVDKQPIEDGGAYAFVYETY